MIVFRRIFYGFTIFAFLLGYFQGVLAQEIPVIFPQPLSDRIANYNIDVRLDAGHKKLDGRQVLIWHNKTGRTLTELQFHLYLNGFRNSESTMMADLNGRTQSSRVPDDGWGYINVNRLLLDTRSTVDETVPLWPELAEAQLSGMPDLSGEMRFIHPDDNNENDKTVFVLTLPTPLRPGQIAIVYFDFEAKLPEPPIQRSGAKDEFFFVAQWFPKIGVYTNEGWNTHQYHVETEFFADFGVYNVRMTVPQEHIVGAVGIEVANTENADSTRTYFYHAEDVHDFAWTASPEFVVLNDRAADVDVRLLIQPDHVGLARRHFNAARYGIESFQKLYGHYPFPNLTIVDPRRGASGVSGMEYPTFFTAGTSYRTPVGIHLLEDVVIHEFGHNYWYLMLASNEFEESWLDEGISTYTDIQVTSDPDGPVKNLIDLFGIKLDHINTNRAATIVNGTFDPIITAGWDFYSRGSYGTNSYSKPGIALTTLHNYLGEETMLKIMQTYVQRWRFKHPTSQDFFDVANEVSGQDLSWFFDQAFYSTWQIDYSVDRIFSRPVRSPRGYDYTLRVQKPDSTTTDGAAAESSFSASVESDTAEIDFAAMGPDSAMPNDTLADSSQEADSAHEAKQPETTYLSGVNVCRIGEFRFPVEVKMVFANGEVIRENWDGEANWMKYRYVGPSRLVSATVDPDEKIVMDINFTNNSKTMTSQSLGVNKVSARALFWTQFLLDQPESFNYLYSLISLLGL